MRPSIVLVVVLSLATGALAGEKSPVDEALVWLSGQQNADGSWNVQGKAGTARSAASTGFALLAFLGAGNTHKTGPHAGQVRDGLRWLKSAQSAEGQFLDDRADPLRTHAIAAVACVETYGMTASPIFKKSSQAAIDYAAATIANLADDELPDAVTTSWLLMAMKSAKLGGLKVSDVTIRRCLAHLDAMTDESTGKIEAETADRVAVATAAATVGRIMGGLDPKTDQMVGKGLAFLRANPPTWEETGVDPRFVYFGSLASFQGGGTVWRDWNAALGTAIVEHRIAEGEGVGTWELGTDGARALGPVASVAALTLALEVRYRYARVFR